MAELAGPRASPILYTKSLRKVFAGDRSGHEVVALGAIDLSVRDGEFLALLGPSGCGKTTLLRILAGQEQPTSGEVRIDGRDMSRVPPEARPVNMVFQGGALFPHLTVFDNVAFGPRMGGASRRDLEPRVQEMLALVRLEGFEQRSISQLSGGEAGRVALARALINKPRVLLLDEPLAALDLKLRKAMQLELKAIHQRLATTFIYVTHDQEEAITMADRIAIMSAGAIIQSGSPIEIYQRPASVFASRFIGESNVIEATVASAGTGQVTVHLGAHVVAATTSQQVSAGQSVWLAIRPEDLRLGSDAPDAAAPRGTITNALFLGPTIRYEIDLGGVIVVATEPFVGGTAVRAAGSVVTVIWDPANARVLMG